MEDGMKFGIHNVLRPFHLHIVFAIASRLAPCVPMNILNHCCRWTCQMLLNANHHLFSVPKIPAMKIEFMLHNLNAYFPKHFLCSFSIMHKSIPYTSTCQCKHFLLYVFNTQIFISIGNLTKPSFNTTTLSNFLKKLEIIKYVL